MISIDQMATVLDALPDPAFILSRSGKYVAVFGGRDKRYYHDGSNLVGLYIADLIKPDKAQWFIDRIAQALESRKLLIEEYELGSRDVKGLPDDGPENPIWFEGRIQALSFSVDDEDVVLWVASNISERHALEIKLRELSDTDQLTGLFNRLPTVWREAVEELWRRRLRTLLTLLGMIFGVARGLVIVLALVVVGGMTMAAQQKWWVEAYFSTPLETAVMAGKPWLPQEIAKRIRFR